MFENDYSITRTVIVMVVYRVNGGGLIGGGGNTVQGPFSSEFSQKIQIKVVFFILYSFLYTVVAALVIDVLLVDFFYVEKMKAPSCISSLLLLFSIYIKFPCTRWREKYKKKEKKGKDRYGW